MNLRQIRVIDPVLSAVALGFSNPEFVGSVLFPYVDVDVSGGQIIQFGKESFRKYNLRRAPGADTKRVTFGYAGQAFALLQDSVEIPLPFENQRDARSVGIDLQAASVKKGMQIITKALEDDQAVLATTAANYPSTNKVTLASTTKWSAATGTPVDDIDTAKQAIRQQTGMLPNTLLLSAQAFKAAKNNAQVVERFKYTNSQGVITTKHLADLFDVANVAIGNSISMTDADVASDIWGNNAILAYVAPNAADADTPSFGFTYRMRGQPKAEEPYEDRPAKSWVFPTTLERAPVIACSTAGYLIQNPL